jgi:hypothetical protein
MNTSTVLWFVAVFGGPVMLAVAIIYGIMRQRRLTSGERATQKEAVDELYERKP